MSMSSRWRAQGSEAEWLRPSLMDIPDLRQQRWQLLVLEPQGEDLLRVHGAQCAQAHKLHQHARKAQLVLWAQEGGGCWPCPAL